MCRQTCRVADRKLMETMCPLLKTPCAAEKRSAPFCMLMYGWDRGIVAAPSVSTSWSRSGQTSTGRMCICFSIGSLCHVSESIPPQSRLCSRMTFQQHCHFYWFSCCVEGEGERGRGLWFPGVIWKWSPSLLCLVVFFKWPSNPAAVRLLSLASLSVATVRSVIAVAQCRLSACLLERVEEKRGGRPGLAVSRWHSRLFSPTPLFSFLLSGNCSAIGFLRLLLHCDWLPFPIPSTSATPTSPPHPPPPQPVSHPRLADWQGPCLSCWALNNLNKIFVRAKALCHGPNMSRRATTS